MYKVLSNQYIPRNSRSLPSGMPACATYYYIVDPNGKTIDKVTHKPYKGKQLDRYWMHSEAEAEKLCEEINAKWRILPSLERYPEFKKLVNALTVKVCKEINATAPKIESSMPYKCQFVLEVLIQELEKKV